MALAVQPIDFAEACEFVRRLHRHHRPPLGSKFAVGANDGEKVVGVIIVGRPVARLLDNGTTCEATRCCTDGTRNVCSLLYGAAWRVAKAMGYRRMVTYTLPEEGGASLKAAGGRCVGEAGGTPWSHHRRPGADDWPQGVKWRWEWEATGAGERFRVVRDVPAAATLFD